MKTPSADNIVTLVTPEYQQDELAKRRRSLEAKRIALHRQFEELEADEALAKDEPLWNKNFGNVPTTETIRRLTHEAVEHLESNEPCGALSRLESAADILKAALNAEAAAMERARQRRKRRDLQGKSRAESPPHE